MALLIALALLTANTVVWRMGHALTGADLIAFVLVVIGVVGGPLRWKQWRAQFLALPFTTRWATGLMVIGGLLGQLVSEYRFSTTGTIKGMLLTPLVLVAAVFFAHIPRKQVVLGVVAFVLLECGYLFTQGNPPLRVLAMLLLIGIGFLCTEVKISPRLQGLLLALCVLTGMVFTLHPPINGVVTGPELTHGLQYFPLAGQGMNRLPLMYGIQASPSPLSFYLYMWLSTGLIGLLGYLLFIMQKERSLPLMVFATLGLLGGISVLPVTFVLLWLALYVPQFPDKQS